MPNPMMTAGAGMPQQPQQPQGPQPLASLMRPQGMAPPPQPQGQMPPPVPPGGGGFNFGGGGGGRGPTDAAGYHSRWQEAQAEYDRLSGGMGADDSSGWVPETRKAKGGGIEYNIGGQWATQRQWSHPAFQQQFVEPYKARHRQEQEARRAKQMAEQQALAAQYQFEYEDYLRRQEEIKAEGTSGNVGSNPGGGSGMVGSGRY